MYEYCTSITSKKIQIGSIGPILILVGIVGTFFKPSFLSLIISGNNIVGLTNYTNTNDYNIITTINPVTFLININDGDCMWFICHVPIQHKYIENYIKSIN